MKQLEFIPYEQALALKELGFDENCIAQWYHQEKLLLNHHLLTVISLLVSFYL